MTDFEKEFRDILLSNDFERFEKEILTDIDALLRCPTELMRTRSVWKEASDEFKKALFSGMKCDPDFVKMLEIPADVAIESLMELLKFVSEHSEDINKAFEGEQKNDYS